MGFVRLFLGLVVREHAIKLWPYLCRRSPISQTACLVFDRPRIVLDYPQPCGYKPAFGHGPEPPVGVLVWKSMYAVAATPHAFSADEPLQPALSAQFERSLLSFLMTFTQ